MTVSIAAWRAAMALLLVMKAHCSLWILAILLHHSLRPTVPVVQHGEQDRSWFSGQISFWIQFTVQPHNRKCVVKDARARILKFPRPFSISNMSVGCWTTTADVFYSPWMQKHGNHNWAYYSKEGSRGMFLQQLSPMGKHTVKSCITSKEKMNWKYRYTSVISPNPFTN